MQLQAQIEADRRRDEIMKKKTKKGDSGKASERKAKKKGIDVLSE